MLVFLLYSNDTTILVGRLGGWVVGEISLGLGLSLAKNTFYASKCVFGFPHNNC
jgi:hypothetical protein